MHFDDLTLCGYDNGPLSPQQWISPLLAVGWLDQHRPYPIGTTDRSVSDRLSTLVQQAHVAFPHYLYRGEYDCALCISAGSTPPQQPWSQECILVPGNGVIYASPGGIVHYMQAHGYCPPPAFALATLQCPDYTSPEFFDALIRANRGGPLPIESAEDSASRLRKSIEDIIRAREIKRSFD
jgi:hypothetical protein